jgi:magnesium-transporting ATPase (P-type)
MVDRITGEQDAAEHTRPPRFLVQCEEPDQDLYRFAGNLTLEGRMYSLSEKQFLPRGSTLMNTRDALALVVYTGHETKVMKNARPSRHKLSRVDTLTSRTVVAVFALQMLLCAAAAIGSVVQTSMVPDNMTHMGLSGSTAHSRATTTLLIFLSFVVLMNTLIPISLVITVEIVKTAHARFISWDAQMRDPLTGAGAIANTSSLTDELGQVKFIFTDKTGTLTQNQMAFRKCSVGGKMYGVVQVLATASASNLQASNARLSSGGALRSKQRQQDEANTLALASVGSRVSLGENHSPPNVVSHNSTGSFNLGSPIGAGTPELRSVCVFRGILRNLEARESRLALAMALCHTVVCERGDVSASTSFSGLDASLVGAAGVSGSVEIKYNADSPDEVALVKGAEPMGVRLLSRVGSQLLVAVTEELRERGGAHLKTTTYTLAFEVLRVVHFSSDRKRMSVVLRDEGGRVRLVCKGADSVIIERCEAFTSPKAETMAHVDHFAAEGFRTLLFAERELVRICGVR